MVIKSKIYDFLKKNLGEYLYGFQKNQLEVGLLSGHIDLVNVNFRPDKVNQLLGVLGLPIQIKAGLLGKLRLKCHYTSFLSSPVEVEIDELLLVFGPITHIAREETPLFEEDSENSWQVEMEQKIVNQSRTSQKNMDFREGTPNMFEDDTPRFPKHVHEQNSGISEEIYRSHKSSYVNSEDDATKHTNTHNRHKLQSHNVEDSTNGINSTLNDKKKNVKQPSVEERNIPARQSRDHGADGIPRRPPLDPKNQYQPKQEKKGFLEKYFSKVLKNLVLTINSVHIRYEDETYPYNNPYTIGFSLSKLEVKNVSQEWIYKDLKVLKRNPRKNAVVKEVIFQNFAMYICSMASVVIPTSLWEATIRSEIGIFEAFPAYEVREIIIQESRALSSAHSSTFIEPTNINLCISFYEEAPTFRLSGVVDKVKCCFSASMAECIRNFFDYCTNVQIWPLILRFRPYCRIPERPEKREHRKERRKKREIVRLWFQYAFAFVKTKQAAIRFVKERKKDNEHFRKMEKQEKINEKLRTGRHQVQPKNDSFVEASTDISKRNSIFSSRQRKVPGTSGIKLDELVKEYNTSKKSNPSIQLKRRPYDGDLYFPKVLTNSEVEFSVHSFSLSIVDEDTKLSMEIEGFDLNTSIFTLLDEMRTSFDVGGFTVGIKDQTKSTEIVKSCRKPGAPGLNKALHQDAKVIKICKIYRPAEILIPNDIYLSMNMYEITCSVAPFAVNYTHNALNNFFVIKEAMELDKCFRDGLNFRFIKALKKNCKKRRMPKVFGIDLKKFALCKHMAGSVIKFQENIGKYIGDLHTTISPILFNYQFDIEGGVIHFHDFSQSSVLDINLPSGKIEIGKGKENSFLNALGFTLESASTPAALHEFISTIFSVFSEKIKLIKDYSGYKGYKLE